MEKGEFQERTEVRQTEGAQVTKKSSATSLLCLIFAIATIGLGAYIAAEKLGFIGDKKVANDKQGTEKCLVTQEQVDNPEEGSIAEIVATANDELDIRDLIKEITIGAGDYAGSLRKTYDSNYIYVDMGGYKAAIKRSYSASFGNYRDLGAAAGSSAWDFLRNYLDTTLKDNGFEQKEFEALGYAEGYTARYESEELDAICTYESRPDYDTTVTCAKKSWMTDADKELYAAFYKAYGHEGVALGAPTITEGKDGYERAHVNISEGPGGAMGLFYHKKGEDWKFYMAVQQVLECSSFDTDELRDAFAGESCIGDAESGRQLKKFGE